MVRNALKKTKLGGSTEVMQGEKELSGGQSEEVTFGLRKSERPNGTPKAGRGVGQEVFQPEGTTNSEVLGVEHN